ncbi:hypothetical protein BSZ37_11185 [Rubrivirga marina]|uniref:Uncharacterized protein n=2 Tax=Rubrivirga marina TaxID=1196024 RepID=A0A271J1N4_9BACT|nr:hypothetical protein BSZ37_11185 [Rubrivirga marina]
MAIVTFNHDMLIEALLDRNQIPYTTGFLPGDVGEDYFSPDLLFPEPSRNVAVLGDDVVRVIKVHGSVNWRVGYIGEDYNKMKRLISLTDDEIRGGPRLSANHLGYAFISQMPYLLTGGGKEGMYNYKTYGHLQHAFQNWLDISDIVFVAGFGWNDKGASDMISRWMEFAGNKCLFSHTDPRKALFDSKWGRNLLAADVDRSGGLRYIEKFMRDIAVDDIESLVGV